jgi:hypothetical protein
MKHVLVILALIASAFAKVPYDRPKADLLYHQSVAAIQNAHCQRPPHCLNVRLNPLIIAFVAHDEYGYQCGPEYLRVWFPSNHWDDVWFAYSIATCTENLYHDKLTPPVFEDRVVLAVNSARAHWNVNDKKNAAWWAANRPR